MRNPSINQVQPLELFTTAALYALLLFTSVACAAPLERSTTEKSSDGDLLRGVLANSTNDVRYALLNGGNPNRIYGPGFSEWAMCAATRKGSEDILTLLLDNAGNPSLVNAPAAYTKEHPLTCALSRGNREAFNILISAGADLALTTCLECRERRFDSLFVAALNSSNLDIARELLDVVKVSDDDLRALVNLIETRQTLPGSEFARYTLEFVDYLAERGITAVPPYPME